MTGTQRFWMRGMSLFMLVTGTCVAEDFLYVYATPPGQRRAEIHWVPVRAPQSARVLIEGIEGRQRIDRHRGELWWRDKGGQLVMGDLVGQNEEPLTGLGLDHFTHLARQGDLLYWISGSRLGTYRLSTGRQRVVLTESAIFGGLAVYEDRVYFGNGFEVESMRLDGGDRLRVGSIKGTSSLGRGVSDLVVQDGRVLWMSEGLLVQVDLETGEESRTPVSPDGGVIPGESSEASLAMAVTNEALYWVDGRTVWKLPHGATEPDRVYSLGDTRLSAIAAVSAAPRAATIGEEGRFHVLGSDGEIYQLLYSEDLQSWSPDYVRRSLFVRSGVLEWLSPKPGVAGELISWLPRVDARAAYFSAWQYDLGDAFDADGDDLPDYWERRHFGDLQAGPDGDTNSDGIPHLEESRAYVSPHSIDSDSDGLTDAEELLYDPPLTPGTADTDGDTLTDGDEVKVYGSNPHFADTDLDGFTDEFEVAHGSDPTDRANRPATDGVLSHYADDLTVHFDFESPKDALLTNQGVLGGAGTVVGKVSYIARETTAGGTSAALNFPRDPNDFKPLSFVQTDFTLAESGLTDPEAGFTISLWVKLARFHWGTLIGAARTGGADQAIALLVQGPPARIGEVAGPLDLSLNGETWSSEFYSPEVMHPDIWMHLCWVSGPEGIVLYVNGRPHIRSAPTAQGHLEDHPTLWLGARQGPTSVVGPFFGAMDEVRVYRRALSKNVVKVLAR